MWGNINTRKNLFQVVVYIDFGVIKVFYCGYFYIKIHDYN
jgi:hypothetical protein